MKTLVSVQIPTYNQENYIGEAIKSCIEQDYQPLEIIVSDDASKDQTGARVAEIRTGEIKYFKNVNNIGRVANYHKALYEYVTGKWVVNLDGDDCFTNPLFISHALEAIRVAGDSKVVFFQANHQHAQLTKVFPAGKWLNETDILIDGKEYFLKFPHLLFFMHCATLFNRESALAIDFYTHDCLSSDFHSMSRLALTGQVILSTSVVASWRDHAGNQSKKLDEKHLNEELDALKDIARFAHKYLSAQQADKWLRAMTKMTKNRYIEFNIPLLKGTEALKMVIAKGQFGRFYCKAIMKAIIKIIIFR